MPASKLGWASWVRYAPVLRGRGRLFPRLLQVFAGPGRSSRAARPFSPRPRSPHASPIGVRAAGCSSALPGVTPPSHGEADRGRGAHLAPLPPPPCSPCSRSCWSYQGSSSSAEKSSIPAALRMALRGRALRRRGSGPRCGARDNAAEAGPGSRVADSGCSAPARAAPLRHRPLTRRPQRRSGPAGVLRSRELRAAAAQRVEGRGRRAVGRPGGPGPAGTSGS